MGVGYPDPIQKITAHGGVARDLDTGDYELYVLTHS